MSIKFFRAFAVAGIALTLCWPAAASAANSSRHAHVSVGDLASLGGCPAWNDPPPTRLGCTTTEYADSGGVSFGLHWEPPMSEQMIYGIGGPGP